MKVFLLCPTVLGEIGSSNQENGVADEAVTTRRRLQGTGAGSFAWNYNKNTGVFDTASIGPNWGWERKDEDIFVSRRVEDKPKSTSAARATSNIYEKTHSSGFYSPAYVTTAYGGAASAPAYQARHYQTSPRYGSYGYAAPAVSYRNAFAPAARHAASRYGALPAAYSYGGAARAAYVYSGAARAYTQRVQSAQPGDKAKMIETSSTTSDKPLYKDSFFKEGRQYYKFSTKGHDNASGRITYSSMDYGIWGAALLVTCLFLALFAFWCKRRSKKRDPRHADIRTTAGRPTHSNVLVTRSHASRRNQRKSLNSLAKHVSEIQSLSKRGRSSKHTSETRRASQSCKRKSSHSLSKPRRSSKKSQSLSERMSRRTSKHMSHSSSSKRNRSLSRRKSQSFSKSNKDKSKRGKSSTAHRHLKKAISEDRAKRAAKGLE